MYYGYLVICRTILRMISKPGLSSGTSFQHLCMSSDNGSGQSCPDMSGRKYGSSRNPTLSKMSIVIFETNSIIITKTILFKNDGNEINSW